VKFRVCSDVGGTFSDLFVFEEESGSWDIFKSPTTPDDVTVGVIETLRLVSEYYNMPLKDFMAQCASFTHGSTIATNAIIQRKVAKVGLICTKGFRDILTRREIGKDSAFEWDMDYPEPYVPRYLTLPVTERINSEGGVEIPLDEDDVRTAIRQLKKYNVEVIAICLMWSVVNPVHEQRINEIIKEEWPEVPTVLSSELTPIIREYRRTSSTVINASLIKVVRSYVSRLARGLEEIGYQSPIAMLTSSGGIAAVDEIARKPIYSVDSGPAMTPVAGRAVAEMERGVNNVITVDMGGTSFDICAITNGNIMVSRDCKVLDHYLGISKVDSRSIGAGGGSIAWVDPGGLARVGPQSAGAIPGPACYGLGGTEPTVTDANIVLGYLNPDYFLGGRLKLAPQLSESAICEKIATPLKLGILEAAFTIWMTVNYNMLGAIQDMTVWQGIDPREYLIVAGGGAAGMHIQAIAKELGMKEILIPKFAGVLSSVGGIFSNLIGEFSSSYFTESTRFNYDAVNDVLARLEKQAEEFLLRHNVVSEDGKIEFYVEARYPYQIWELDVPLRSNRIRNEQELRQMVDDFHDVHGRVFAIKEPEQYIECVHWRVRAIGEVAKPAIKELSYGGKDPSAALKGKRSAYFGELGGLVETLVYDGAKLMYGNRIEAPAIIEEPTTTIVILPGGRATVTKFGSYLVELTD